MIDLTIKEMSLIVGNYLGLDFSDNLFWHLPKKDALLKWLSNSGNDETANMVKESWNRNGYLLFAEWLAVYNTIPKK
jgi:homoserine trans-succinylase